MNGNGHIILLSILSTKDLILLGFEIGTANIQKINKGNCLLVAFLVEFYLNYLYSNVCTVVELPLLG